MKSRKGLVVKISIVFILIVIGYFVIDYFKENPDILMPNDDNQVSMHNSPRYFFRIKDLENWELEAGSNNFMLDDEKQLVLRLHPLIENPDKTPLNIGDEDVEEPKIWDKTATVSVYYFPIEEGLELELSDAMNITINRLLESDMNVETDQLTTIMPYRTDHLEFSTIGFTYFKDLIPQKGEIYVVIRSIAYYVIFIEAENDLIAGSSYNRYKDNFKEIIDSFILSVFEDYKDVQEES